MFNVVLYQPEIPPNTGNIIRLCANTGSRLHLIYPLGFELSDKSLKRAGLDYHERACTHTYDDLNHFMEVCEPKRLFAFSTKGGIGYAAVDYKRDDFLLFGPETRGLPNTLLKTLSETKHVLRLPMVNGSRSLNLSNAVSVALYEAWRQQNFAQGL